MPIATLDITLLQPVVISSQSGSAGSHQGLDFIPGATLLGHAAANLYAGLSADDAWTVFHSGKIRFGDALPLVADELALPMPLSWHIVKGDAATADGRLPPGAVFDPALAAAPGNRQPAQLRSGYVTASGRLVLPARLKSAKTAIDASTGRAAESQLFGYEALAPGQAFRAVLSADDAVPQALWQKLVEAVSGRARLGRSRSAQYGEVQIRCTPSSASAAPPSAGSRLTLWLLSDLALESAGQPCLLPDPGLLGLPPGSRWLPEESFLRQRRYSPYNAYRRHYDCERQVISRGSVLRYELAEALDEASLQGLTLGLGAHLESGLGQVVVNPDALAQAHPRFQEAGTVQQASTRPPAAQVKPTAFISALRARHQRNHGGSAEDDARTLHKRYRDLIGQALRFDPFAQPPGRSQWGRMKQLASDLRQDPAALFKALFDDASGAARPRKNTGWEVRYGVAEGDTLSAWLRDELDSRQVALPALLGHLAALELHADTDLHQVEEATP